jgi:hypothetical protein
MSRPSLPLRGVTPAVGQERLVATSGFQVGSLR